MTLFAYIFFVDLLVLGGLVSKSKEADYPASKGRGGFLECHKKRVRSVSLRSMQEDHICYEN